MRPWRREWCRYHERRRWRRDDGGRRHGRESRGEHAGFGAETDLLVAAAQTGAVINVKKGQFLAPWDMKHVVDKLVQSGNSRVLLTERGTSFGYNTLVSDMRSLPQMRDTGFPVIFDATHSVQQPGGLGGASGGQREFVPVLARAAVAVGVDGLFMESHQNPDNAPSDGPNMVPLDQMPELLATLSRLAEAAKS